MSALSEDILNLLLREKRSVSLERSLLILVYLACGLIFFVFGVYCLTFLLIIYGFPLLSVIWSTIHGGRWKPWLPPYFFAIAIILITGLLRPDKLYSGTFYPRRATRFRPLDVEFSATAFEGFCVIFLSGPRFAVMALEELKKLIRLRKLDITKLIAPIETAFSLKRKIKQDDLPGVDLKWFLENTEWLSGIARLYAPPIGFVLMPEFRRTLLRLQSIDVESDPDPESADDEPEPHEIESERDWALRAMGLSGTPTRDEIKRAYRELAKLCHPDVCGRESESAMKEPNRAREILDASRSSA